MTRKAGRPYGITPKNYPEFMASCSEHMVRKGRDMAGYFLENPDQEAVIYEVYEAECAGNTCTAITILKPGKAGNEYYMTKGHFHEDEESGETYICLKGRGIILMQTRDGKAAELWLEPGTVACIPPGWAHRTVNIGKEEFVMVAVFPACSGHDYGAILEKGFLKRVVEEGGKPQVI
ncbi:MAG: glucose-6-phosphate isomerase family protein [Thermoplasmata archaeon]